MAEGASISRQAFDEMAARLGINGSADHMDELFRQVQGVLDGARSLGAINVADVEPDTAFKPSGPRQD